MSFPLLDARPLTWFPSHHTLTAEYETNRFLANFFFLSLGPVMVEKDDRVAQCAEQRGQCVPSHCMPPLPSTSPYRLIV